MQGSQKKMNLNVVLITGGASVILTFILCYAISIYEETMVYPWFYLSSSIDIAPASCWGSFGKLYKDGFSLPKKSKELLLDSNSPFQHFLIFNRSLTSSNYNHPTNSMDTLHPNPIHTNQILLKIN